MMRSISLNELEGFRQALLELCISVDLSDYETIDLCGTGGDGKDTLIYQRCHLYSSWFWNKSIKTRKLWCFIWLWF